MLHDSLPPSIRCSNANSLPSSLWEKLYVPGRRKSPRCGDSPRTTESLKDSTTSWKTSRDKPTDSETSKTTDSESGYCAHESDEVGGAPTNGVEPAVGALSGRERACRTGQPMYWDFAESSTGKLRDRHIELNPRVIQNCHCWRQTKGGFSDLIYLSGRRTRIALPVQVNRNQTLHMPFAAYDQHPSRAFVHGVTLPSLLKHMAKIRSLGG